MGESSKERLSRILNEHLNTVHETFQLWDQAPASSLDKVGWNDIINLGEQVSKQATMESRSKDQKLSIPRLVGTVWDACSALKKTPTTNVTAIGRAMTQVAVSMKDVLREMKELKSASEQADEASDEASIQAESKPDDSDDSSEGDLGNDLSPEEMKIAQLAIGVTSETLEVTKELICCISGLLEHENLDNIVHPLNSLERLLKHCQGTGVLIDELGACLYPPQELPAIKATTEDICSTVDEMKVELDILDSSSEAFVQACSALRSSMRQLESEVGCSDATDLVPALENLAVGN
ncbi:hypothetical protein RJ639_019314 [Escallonia herrerae]|uniref:Cyclin-D1-binding protein 1 n=1 Tax=Escallonia herrerae TaxID=1293975 RepID=A0AA88V8N0_9ASTE|nr:hypothetical protein RJ639_019314 [Escallonia herrerae]